MTDKVVVQGQIYRVMVTGKAMAPDGLIIIRNEYAVIGTSADEVRAKLTYVIDVSEYCEYLVDYVVKESGRACLLRHHAELVRQEAPDAVIRRKNGSDAVWQKTVVNPSDRRFVVHCATACFASNAEHAKKKFKRRARESEELLQFSIEEVPVSDGLARAKDVSIFPKARLIGIRG
ncbi:MAG TPA: hypothetical protein PK440_00655 [Candidatus Accumulibacter phosphatis]|nr:MAG: hypothetical protein AW07_00464 [Candidatus Accumulibacter sp. SK-11]HRQ93512.1 hypothetical protein [Candidatus Accumulibacter phosphatis]